MVPAYWLRRKSVENDRKDFMMGKIEIIQEFLLARVNNPYIFGTSGQKCTPERRIERAEKHPDYAANIYKYCPVLSKKQSSCSGCKYKGKQAYDCRGLSFKAAQEAGIDMTSIGATKQWNDDCWAVKGEIADIQNDNLCVTFRQKQENHAIMSHTGVYLGDGNVIDARGHRTGVVMNTLDSYPWTHFGIWKGLYDEEESHTMLPTLSKGSVGERVAEMQSYLQSLRYNLGPSGADGKFGPITENALIKFQRDNQQINDGVCGEMTWCLLLLKAGNMDDME
jgi:cell wall-associated NlpC family hydrolase